MNPVSPASAAKDAPLIPNKVTIVPIPTKFVFLYPSILLAGIMAFLAGVWPAHNNLWGQVFLFFLFVNFIVVTFEFPRATVLTVVLGIAAGILALYFLNQWVRILGPLADWFAALNTTASPQFYSALCVGGFILAAAVWFMTRFDYWELTANELIHHKGLLGDIERFSTNGMKLNKEITDIFEYLILRSATLVVSLPTQTRPIVLDNILFIQFIMNRADKILQGGKEVRVEKEIIVAKDDPGNSPAIQTG